MVNSAYLVESSWFNPRRHLAHVKCCLRRSVCGGGTPMARISFKRDRFPVDVIGVARKQSSELRNLDFHFRRRDSAQASALAPMHSVRVRKIRSVGRLIMRLRNLRPLWIAACVEEKHCAESIAFTRSTEAV